MAQASTAATTAAGRSRRAPSGAGRGAPRPHLGRLALLALVLIGASFYVSPLRSFFQQQDRYTKAVALDPKSDAGKQADSFLSALGQ